MPRPTMTAEVRRAREMRAKGETFNAIAGELDRCLNWAFKHTKGIGPDKGSNKRARKAIELREAGMEWAAIARKVGYKNSNTARVAVCRERRRQREEVTK